MNQSQRGRFSWTQIRAAVLLALWVVVGGQRPLFAEPVACGKTQFPTADDDQGAADWCKDGVHADTFAVKTLRSTSKRFKNPIPKTGPQDENNCFNWSSDGTSSYSSTCSCGEHVQAFSLLGDTAGIHKINAADAAEAKAVHCSPQYALASRSIVKINVSRQLLSKVIRTNMRVQSSGGSCHGGYTLETYDLGSGHHYKLSEIVNKTPKSALDQELLSSFSRLYQSRWDGKSTADPRSEEENKRTYQNAMARTRSFLQTMDPGTTGVMIEKNKVWKNIPEFLFGCASGNLYPVSLANHLLKAEFLKQLDKDRAAQAQ